MYKCKKGHVVCVVTKSTSTNSKFERSAHVSVRLAYAVSLTRSGSPKRIKWVGVGSAPSYPVKHLTPGSEVLTMSRQTETVAFVETIKHKSFMDDSMRWASEEELIQAILGLEQSKPIKPKIHRRRL